MACEFESLKARYLQRQRNPPSLAGMGMQLDRRLHRYAGFADGDNVYLTPRGIEVLGNGSVSAIEPEEYLDRIKESTPPEERQLVLRLLRDQVGWV